MKDILYGVKLAILQELNPKTQLPNYAGAVCRVDTAESVEMEPVESEGAEEVSRSDEKILAIVRTPDLLYGYDVTMVDNTFDPEISALIEGGTVERNQEDEVVGYRSPMLSEGSTKMKPFRLTLFVANYEGDSIKNYVKVVCNNCSGKAPKFSAAKEFYAPEFSIKAREATKANLPIKSLDYSDSLPSDTKPTISTVDVSVGVLGEGAITGIPAATTVTALSEGITLSDATASVVITDAVGNVKTAASVLTDDDILYAYNDDSGLSTAYTLTLEEE